MPRKLDLSADPSPDAIARAKADYGDKLDPGEPIYRAFAAMIAAGESATAAYSRLYPTASRDTARTQGSTLASHPDVRRWAVSAGLPGRELIGALVPAAVEELGRLLGNEKAEVRRKAADSILDRGGVPKRTEVATQLTADIQMSAQALLEVAAQLPRPEVPTGDPRQRAALPPASDPARLAPAAHQIHPDEPAGTAVPSAPPLADAAPATEIPPPPEDPPPPGRPGDP